VTQLIVEKKTQEADVKHNKVIEEKARELSDKYKEFEECRREVNEIK
jgi:hypothetical protein